MLQRRLVFLALALLLTILVAGLAGTAFERRLATFETLGAELTQRHGVWVVGEVEVASTGLVAGDVVTMVEGDQEATLASLRQSLRAKAETSLLVLRGDEMVEVTYRRPALAVDWAYLALTGIGILYLLTGLITAFKDHQLQAKLFFLWCLTSAAFFVLSPVLPVAERIDQIIHLGDQIARLLLPALTLHLFLVFPTRMVQSRWLGRLVPGLYLPSAFLALFHVDQVLAGGEWIFGPATVSQVAVLDRVELIYIVGTIFVAVAAMALRFRRRPGWEHKRQVQWITAGLACGYLPFTLLYLLPWVLGFQVSSLLTLMAVTPLALAPLAFAWAILKYKLLDLDVILRDVLSWSATALVGIFGFQIVHLVIQANVPSGEVLGRNFLTFAAGLVLAGVLVPTRRALADGFERWQHGGRLGPRRRLRSLGQEMLYERDLDRLCRTLIEGLEDALVARANLYLAQDGDTMAPMRLQDDVPRVLGFGDLGASLWTREVESISALELPGDELSPAQRLFRAGYRYAFPVLVRGHRIGLLVMGYKFDDEPLAGEDVELVRFALDRGALAIENAQLLGQVSHQLSEVSRLESYNEGILQSSPAGIAVLDADDVVRSCNQAFATLCGHPTESEGVVGQCIDDLIPVRPLPEPGTGLHEVSWCEPSGAERYLQLSCAIWTTDLSLDETAIGQGQRVLVAQDVSERVAMERELKEKEHLASLGVLAAGVAHEVNTPLTGISSYAQFLLADTAEDDPHFTILKKMERQTFRAAQIVNNLLDFARNRHGEATRVRLDTLVGDSLHLLEERADRAGVDIDYSRPDQHFDVLGNESELHQVITNLVVNALEAMGDQSEPRLLRLRVDQAGRRVRLRVSDSGPGVPRERLDTIFKPFFSSKLEKGGSGLGLALTYNIVRRHGGEIRVDNHPRPERGCTFTVELPPHVSASTDASSGAAGAASAAAGA